MRRGLKARPVGRPVHRGGFSLIEMIGVLAIIAIVAAVLTPNLTRRISRLNGDKEDATLTVIADGVTRYVRNYQVVPGAASWITNASAQTGLSLNEVRYALPSSATAARVYLIHPSFYPTNASTADPLYTQASGGASSVTNARVIILSTHKSTLTLPVSSGRASSTTVFDNIWNWTYDPSTKAPPSGWDSTWTGNGEYLHVQRVNLAGNFNRVTFSNMDFPTVYPSIQVGSTTVSLTSTSAIDTFFLEGTFVRLFKDNTDADGSLDLGLSITGSANFIYEDSQWRVP